MLLKGNGCNTPLKSISAIEKGTHKASLEFMFQSGHWILEELLQFGPYSENSYQVSQKNVVYFILGPQESRA